MSDRTALAVLGDPLAYTRSPELHRAGFDVLGLKGSSEAIRTTPETLGERLRELAARGYRGVNLTAPLKDVALPLLQRVSGSASVARSVNTVGFEPDGWWGDTTDGPGLVDLLLTLGRSPARQRVTFLGAGGAARSLAVALLAAGAPSVAASARNLERVAEGWREIEGARLVGWRSREEEDCLAGSSLVISAIPPDPKPPAPLASVPMRALILDLAYGPGPTPWVLAARSEGREAYDGLGLLVFQARLSLALWFECPVPVAPLARAVGWLR